MLMKLTTGVRKRKTFWVVDEFRLLHLKTERGCVLRERKRECVVFMYVCVCVKERVSVCVHVKECDVYL